MPNTYNSYHTVAEQIINYNNNVVELLQNFNSLATTTQATLNLTIYDSAGNPTVVSMPSLNNLQTQIQQLNNNLKTIYGLNNNGSVIQTGPNSFQRIVTVDLNLEPADITSISVPTTFISQRNFLFDSLMDPELMININLSGKIDSDVKEILYRRYVVQFQVNSNGNFTTLGNSALASFNSTFNGKSNINLNDFLTWQATTPGILQPGDAEYKEEILPLKPNTVQYDGLFSVLYAETDVNGVLWYYLNTITYTEILTNTPKQLAINDTLIINTANANTIYKIKNISNASSNYKVQLETVTGYQPIPPGTNTLKFYSSILKNQSIDIPVGYNERCVLFVKSLNTTNFILSKKWSSGVGFYTNDLSLSSFDSYNGFSMTQYYNSVVSDYGSALRDLVNKNVPVVQGVTPNSPSLNSANFQVVQTNLHLTNNSNIDLIKKQAAQVTQLDSELQQISNAIQSKNKQIQVTRFSSSADKLQAQNDIQSLHSKYSSTSNLKNSINSQIVAAKPQVIADPEFAVRGFWTIPAAVVPTYSLSNQINAGKPQQIVKFDVQYKRLSKDGTETPVQTFKLYDTSIGIQPTSPKKSVTNTAVYSNWENLATTSLKQVFDASTNTFTWEIDDQNNPEKININQLSINIKPNETIQIRIRSISEVGFPDSPLYSDWSNTITVTFPDSLINSTNHIGSILDDAKIETAKNNILATLNNRGLNDLLSQQTVVNNTTYYMTSDKVLSGFKDTNGNAIDLYDYLKTLTDTIATLQAMIDKAQGTLVVTVFKNNTQFTVQKNTVLNFTVNCEDYCLPHVGPGVPSGRVYANNVYVVKDFFITIANSVANTSLGLLSNITYAAGVNTNVYNSAVPQVFWVDDQDELITSDVTGISKTQIDNQYFWSINYDSVNQTTVTPLSQNIGNLFITNGSNSLTNILSSPEYNLGYSENSVLSFVGNNKSLIDNSKWIDTVSSVSSQNKLLTSIHPSTPQLTNLQETNTQLIHYLTTLNPVNIPINIYFKLNALDNTQTGANYQYVNLNGVSQNVRHIKELKFYLATQNDTAPFIFTLKFTINRVNSIQSNNVSK